MGPLLVILGITVAVTWPEIAVAPLFVILGVGAMVLPIVLYPSSYTVWQALDIVMRPVSEGDFDMCVGVESGSSGLSDAPEHEPGPVRSPDA